jgi:hypothetical protein
MTLCGGIFWVIGYFDNFKILAHKTPCDINGTPTELPRYNSKKGNSFSHERTWESLTQNQPREIRSKAWNYFPRGRVEIANAKATVYHNPQLGDYQEFEASIIKEFGLDCLQIMSFRPDYSRHYRCRCAES